MEDELFFNVPRWKLQHFQNPPYQTSFTETITPGSGARGISEGRGPSNHIVLICWYATVNVLRLMREPAI